MRLGWNANETSVRLLSAAVIAALLFLMVYTFIYWVEPFTDLWNTTLTNMFLVLASASSAVMATLIWRRYEPSDVPRKIWFYFTVGLWLWSAAELTWGYLNITQGEVQKGVPDLFWISAYFFFGYALFVQYQILAHPDRKQSQRLIVTGIGLLLALFLILYWVLTAGIGAPADSGTAINAFYPAADLLLALVAFWLARNFMGGAFSRPWFGVLAFSIADLLYAWMELSGLYSWSVNASNALSTLTDVVYLAAYLVLGWCLLSQWVFMKYGLRSSLTTR